MGIGVLGAGRRPWVSITDVQACEAPVHGEPASGRKEMKAMVITERAGLLLIRVTAAEGPIPPFGESPSGSRSRG